jgi:succinate dehydrogenase/fumarate reductase cytochrome b subunit
MSIIKILIVLCLLGIVASLGTGLFHLVSDKGQSRRMVRALTVRIVLSVALFILLLVAWWQGLLQPHAIGL